MALILSVNDNIVRLGRAQFGAGKTVVEYMNLALAGDIQKYGHGYAINKNYGGGTGEVTKNKKTHFAATATETMTDAQARYYTNSATLP